MKYVLETDDKNEHLYALHGLDWALVCWDLDQYLRNNLNHGDFNDDKMWAFEETRCVLRQYIDDRNISLEMIE